MANTFGYIIMYRWINGNKVPVSVPCINSTETTGRDFDTVIKQLFIDNDSKMASRESLEYGLTSEHRIVSYSDRYYILHSSMPYPSSTITGYREANLLPPTFLMQNSDTSLQNNCGVGPIATTSKGKRLFRTDDLTSSVRIIDVYDSKANAFASRGEKWGIWQFAAEGPASLGHSTVYYQLFCYKLDGVWYSSNFADFYNGFQYSAYSISDEIEYPIDASIINIIPEPGTVSLKRGESVTFNNTIIDSNGFSSQLESAYYDLGIITARTATMQGNTLTISPNATTTGFTITVKPSEDSNVFAIIDVTITDAEGEYSPGGNSGPGGGGGNYGKDETSDPTTPLIPEGSDELNASKSGLFTLYRVSSSQLESLGNELYAETFLEKLKLEVLKLLWNSPIEGVISCMSYPFNIPQATVGVPMKFGSVELDTVGNVLDNSSMTIDWGTVSLSEYWGNFLDYAPHTQIDLYLPWGVGFVNLNPHDVLPGNISIKTNIDITKGVCVHHVIGNHGIIGTYSGICASQFPITAIDTAGKYVGMTLAAVGAMVAGSGAVASSSVGSGITVGAGATNMALSTSVKSTLPALATYSNAPFTVTPPPQISSYSPISRHQIGLASGAAVAAMRHPPHVQRSGNFSNAGVGLSPQKPFIIISRPEQNVPEDYGHMYGYPSNITSQLAYLRGYTEVAAIHLEGIGNATLPELEEIENLLIGGVIL